MIWVVLSKKAIAKANVNIIRTLRAVLAQGEVWVRSCFPFVLRSADGLTACDFRILPDNGTLLSYGIVVLSCANTMKLTFSGISLSGIRLFRYDETKLLSIRIMSPYVENNRLCTEMISAYDNMRALGKGIAVPYADAKKIAGSLIGLVNKMTSAYDDVILPPIDTILPSAEAILPSGLLMTLSSSLMLK